MGTSLLNARFSPARSCSRYVIEDLISFRRGKRRRFRRGRRRTKRQDRGRQLLANEYFPVRPSRSNPMPLRVAAGSAGRRNVRARRTRSSASCHQASGEAIHPPRLSSDPSRARGSAATVTCPGKPPAKPCCGSCRDVGSRLARAPPHGPAVAVTFDDGPDASFTPRILDLLPCSMARLATFSS